MKAAIVTAPGTDPVYADFPAPQAAAGERLVTVTAAALSQLTRARASGRHYSSAGGFPFVAGVDGVGRLDDGTRVYFVMPSAPNGAMAEATAVPATHCLPLPDDLDDVTAASIANPGMSSWAALTERARLKPGETVLVNGATGASGQLAVRIARHLGAARVIATGRNARVLDTLGADATVTLSGDADALEAAFTPHFAAGVDGVLDYLWGPSAQALLIAAAKASPEGRRIRVVQIGSMAGPDIVLPGAVLRATAIELMGSGIGSVPFDRLVAAIGATLNVARPAGLRVDVRTAPLADVARLWTTGEAGRLVLLT